MLVRIPAGSARRRRAAVRAGRAGRGVGGRGVGGRGVGYPGARARARRRRGARADDRARAVFVSGTEPD